MWGVGLRFLKLALLWFFNSCLKHIIYIELKHLLEILGWTKLKTVTHTIKSTEVQILAYGETLHLSQSLGYIYV